MVTQNMLHTHEGKQVSLEKKIRFVTALDLIKCLKGSCKKNLLARPLRGVGCKGLLKEELFCGFTNVIK